MTNKDKDACLPIIDFMVECTKTARKEGVLALEELVKNQDNDFITFTMMLVCDGIDPQLVKGICETLLCADNHSDAERLKRIITIEGALSVQAGETPWLMEMKLLTYLGEEYLRKRGHFPFMDMGEKLEQKFAAVFAKNAGNAAFDSLISSQDDQSIRQAFKQIDHKELALAVKGGNEATARKLLGNVSARLAMDILETAETMDFVTQPEIDAAQNKLTGIINASAKQVI